MAYPITSARTLRKRADGAVAYLDGVIEVEGRGVPIVIQTRKGDAALFTTDRAETELAAETDAAQAIVETAVRGLDDKIDEAQRDAAYRREAAGQLGAKLAELVVFIRDEALPLGLTEAQIAAVLPIVEAEAAAWLGGRIELATAKCPAFAEWDVAAAGWSVMDTRTARARFERAIEASAPVPAEPKPAPAPVRPAAPAKPVAACEMRSSGYLHIRLAYEAERVKRLRRAFPKAQWVPGLLSWKLPFDADRAAADAFVAAEIEQAAS